MEFKLIIFENYKFQIYIMYNLCLANVTNEKYTENEFGTNCQWHRRTWRRGYVL